MNQMDLIQKYDSVIYVMSAVTSITVGQNARNPR